MLAIMRYEQFKKILITALLTVSCLSITYGEDKISGKALWRINGPVKHFVMSTYDLKEDGGQANSPKEHLGWVSEIYFDKEGNITKEVYSASDGVFQTYKNNDLALGEFIVYDGEGKPEGEFTQTSPAENTIERKHFDSRGAFTVKELYTFENNRLTSIKTIANPEHGYTQSYNYNDGENIIEIITHTKQEAPLVTTIKNSQFDSFNNPRKSLIFRNDKEKPSQLITAEYEYYE